MPMPFPNLKSSARLLIGATLSLFIHSSSFSFVRNPVRKYGERVADPCLFNQIPQRHEKDPLFTLHGAHDNISHESIKIDFYNHIDNSGFKYRLSYRHKPASPGFEKRTPWFLVHPVGIGLSSWFWDKLMQEPGPEMYAPDLIGCGVGSGADSWDPDTKSLSFPLGWVQGCESLLQQINSRRGVVVIAQGGLAPVGVLLASRNPQNVRKLVLTSPPEWKFMNEPIPQEELRRNFNFLRSKPWGDWAFNALESKWAIEFFSNAFLFDDPCDDQWLDLAMGAVSKDARPPIQVFNAGFCNHRSFQDELCNLVQQPTLVLSGAKDKRHRERTDYEIEMPDCRLRQLGKGQNVLPWECPAETRDCIMAFCQEDNAI